MACCCCCCMLLLLLLLLLLLCVHSRGSRLMPETTCPCLPLQWRVTNSIFLA